MILSYRTGPPFFALLQDFRVIFFLVQVSDQTQQAYTIMVALQ